MQYFYHYNRKTHEAILEGEDADIAAVVYVVAAHDGVGEVLDPDAGERVARDLVVLVGALRVVRHVQPHVLAVADVAVLDHGVGARAAHAHRRAHCRHTLLLTTLSPPT